MSTRLKKGSKESWRERLCSTVTIADDLSKLILPLALVVPRKGPGEYVIAVKSKSRCGDWLRSQHPGLSLSQVIEAADWQYKGKWAFHGYNWKEGEVHLHGEDSPPNPF